MADATDDFNRADGSLGANWSVLSGSAAISSNGYLGASRSEYVGEDFEADHYSEVTGATLLSGTGGPACRIQDANNMYYIFHDGAGVGATVGLWKLEGGGFANLDSASVTVTNTSVFRIEAIGTTIKGYLNGVEILSATNAVHSGGRPGILSNGGCRYDSWLGGPIAGGEIDGDLDSDGASTVAFVGASTADSAFASNGGGSLDAVTSAQKDAAFSGAGIGAGAFVGASFEVISGVFLSAGIAVPDFVSLNLSEGAFNLPGIGAANFVGDIAASGVLSVNGISSVAFVGNTLREAVWQGSGVGNAIFVSFPVDMAFTMEGMAVVSWHGVAFGGDNWIEQIPASSGWVKEDPT